MPQNLWHFAISVGMPQKVWQNLRMQKMPQKTNIMENRESICKMFGLTQKQMADRLKISRSQWSMFELGKRSLPREATLQFAEMMTSLNAAKEISQMSWKAKQSDKNREALEWLLNENTFQLETVERKLAALKRKITTVNGKSHFAEISKNSDSNLGAENLKSEALDLVKEHTETKMVKRLVGYEVRLEVLQFEAELLMKRLGKV